MADDRIAGWDLRDREKWMDDDEAGKDCKGARNRPSNRCSARKERRLKDVVGNASRH